MTLRALNVTALLVLLGATTGAWLLWNAKQEKMLAAGGGRKVHVPANLSVDAPGDAAVVARRSQAKTGIGEDGTGGKRIAGRSDVTAATVPVKAFAPGEPPQLLPVREATAQRPTQAWERLLAVDGSPKEDVAALRELLNGYLHAGLGNTQRTIGFNEDLVAALTDRAALGDGALPTNHPAIRDGRLLDRWGTPWQVHPLEKDLVELRSAGPDRKLYTADDLVGR